jgi:hypothetical protein
MLQSSKILGKRKKLDVVSIAEWVGLLDKAADENMSADELPALKLLGFFENMAASATKNNIRNKGTTTNTSKEETEEEGIMFDTAGSQKISPSLAACEACRVAYGEH